ncbi:MAG TPA: TIR domain-containing protein [Longimicrobium sp.]|nr:TIR domain-containing protein [Longimicrobium sp.]
MEPPFVFLSYASPDRDRVLRVHHFLLENGVGVWMDIERILPGQHWESEIRRALDAAVAVIVFISQNSVDRTGYVQRELRMVVDKLHERPDHRIYAIPVTLDPGVTIPDALKRLHCLVLADAGGQDQLLKAVHAALGKVERTREAAQVNAGVDWRFDSYKEDWEGLPGYDVEVTWPIYRSETYPLVSQISDAIQSEVRMMVARERSTKLHQWPEHFSFGQRASQRTDLLRVTCVAPVIKDRVLSQQLEIYTYGGGAIHGNYGFSSWVFVMEPLVRIERLAVIFQDPDAGLALLQAEARARLRAEFDREQSPGSEEGLSSSEETAPVGGLWVSEQAVLVCDEAPWDSEEVLPVSEEDPLAVEKGPLGYDPLAHGTADWDAFAHFGFTEDGLLLLFPPYQVAPYYTGSHSVVVPYASIYPFLRRVYADALGLASIDFEQPVPLDPEELLRLFDI